MKNKGTMTTSKEQQFSRNNAQKLWDIQLSQQQQQKKKQHNNFKELQKDNLGESGKQYNHKINIVAESEMEKSIFNLELNPMNGPEW